MGEKSKIAWTDATQNFWVGCRKKSPACSYCYAERWARRSGKDFGKVTRTSPRTFQAPLGWKEPKVIFTCSLSDFFIHDADKWRADAHEIMERTPQHTYLILTKEIERAVRLRYVPPRNALLGVSAENQHWLDRRVPLMLQVPASGYFISAEPLLGPLKFGPWLHEIKCVITGGESGGPEPRMLVQRAPLLKNDWIPKASALEWVARIVDQCEAAGVIPFHKQWGGPRPESGGHLVRGKTYQDMGWAYAN